MGTYLSAAALEQIDQAQAELEWHLVTRPDGRCTTCGGVEPCRARVRLEAVFALYGRLPRRRPGVTRVALRRVERTTNKRGSRGRTCVYNVTVTWKLPLLSVTYQSLDASHSSPVACAVLS